jgi:hypothetical protein
MIQTLGKIIALLLFPIFAFTQTKPAKVSFLDDKVEILVPSELTKMSDQVWTLKYRDMPRPVLALSDENGEVNLLGDLTKQPATEAQLASYKDFRKANLKKSHPEARLLGDSIKTVNGKKVGYIKFISAASDQNIFNYYFFTIENGQILFFTFNCIEKMQSSWEKAADEIVASLKVK